MYGQDPYLRGCQALKLHLIKQQPIRDPDHDEPLCKSKWRRALKGLSLRGILYGELPTDPGPGHEIYRTVQQIVKVRFYEAN